MCQIFLRRSGALRHKGLGRTLILLCVGQKLGPGEKLSLGRESAVNRFPNKPWFSCVYSTFPLKTLWEKEKLLVTSNFSFSHSVFYPFGELCAIFIKS